MLVAATSAYSGLFGPVFASSYGGSSIQINNELYILGNSIWVALNWTYGVAI